MAYQLTEHGEVTLKIYSQTGRLVDFVTESKSAGQQSSAISVNRFATGTYYYILSVRYASGIEETQKPGKFVVLH